MSGGCSERLDAFNFFLKQLRADGIHRRESAGAGPVVPKVVSVTGQVLHLHHQGQIDMPHCWYVVGMRDTKSIENQLVGGNSVV